MTNTPPDPDNLTQLELRQLWAAMPTCFVDGVATARTRYRGEPYQLDSDFWNSVREAMEAGEMLNWKGGPG